MSGEGEYDTVLAAIGACPSLSLSLSSPPLSLLSPLPSFSFIFPSFSFLFSPLRSLVLALSPPRTHAHAHTPTPLRATSLSLPPTHTHSPTLPQVVRLVPPRSASTIPPWGSSWSATGSSRVAFFRPATRSKQTYPTSTVSVFQHHVTYR